MSATEYSGFIGSSEVPHEIVENYKYDIGNCDLVHLLIDLSLKHIAELYWTILHETSIIHYSTKESQPHNTALHPPNSFLNYHLDQPQIWKQ